MDKRINSTRAFSLIIFVSAITALSSSLIVAWGNPIAPNMTRPTVVFAFENPSTSDPDHLTFHLALTMPRDVYLANVYCQLDSELPLALSTGRKLEPFHNFTANITATPDQQHTLFLNIELVSPYDIFGEADPHGHFVQTVVWDANQVVLFSVNTTSTSPALNYTMRSNYAEPIYPPGATHMQPTPTPSPSNTPSPTPPPSISPTQTPTRSLIVTLDSPKNQTYFTNEIQVSVSASDPYNHTGPGAVAYILDGKPQVIFAETPNLGLHRFTNSTILTIPDGSHSIIGVGITWFGEQEFHSEPVYFTVNTPNPTITQTPTTASPTQTSSTEPTTTPNNNQDNFIPLEIVTFLVIVVAVAIILTIIAKNFAKRRGKT